MLSIYFQLELRGSVKFLKRLVKFVNEHLDFHLFIPLFANSIQQLSAEDYPLIQQILLDFSEAANYKILKRSLQIDLDK